MRDIAWYNMTGEEFSEENWNAESNRSLAMMASGKTVHVSDDEGKNAEDDSFLILIKASHEWVGFHVLRPPNGNPWRHVLGTQNIGAPFSEAALEEKIIVGGRRIMPQSDGTLGA